MYGSIFIRSVRVDSQTDGGLRPIQMYTENYQKTDFEYAIKAANPRFYKEKNVFG